MSKLQVELKQAKPFPSQAVEAALNIVRTADLVTRLEEDAVVPFGITRQQYNVLRILRGGKGKPVTPSQIAERLVEQTPGVTRLIDKLVELGLARRERRDEDRRVVYCYITQQGLDLIAQMDDPIDQADEACMSVLSEKELSSLIALLEKVRAKRS